MNSLRVGHGYDVHRLAPGRKLILGGIAIPHSTGLAGHSDADVVLHAIMDALLGAAGLPDIGVHFPPSDPEFKDADSCDLLRQVVGMIRETGVSTVVNVDCTILAERPRLAGFLPAMRERIAQIMGVEASRINVKVTTTEKLGFVGREEGIASEAVCLLSHE